MDNSIYYLPYSNNIEKHNAVDKLTEMSTQIVEKCESFVETVVINDKHYLGKSRILLIVFKERYGYADYMKKNPEDRARVLHHGYKLINNTGEKSNGNRRRSR